MPNHAHPDDLSAVATLDNKSLVQLLDNHCFVQRGRPGQYRLKPSPAFREILVQALSGPWINDHEDRIPWLVKRYQLKKTEIKRWLRYPPLKIAN